MASMTDIRMQDWASCGFGFCLRTLIFAGLWWSVADFDPESWVIGGPAVVLAALAGVLLEQPGRWRWRLRGVLGFLPFFLWHSLKGSLDVAGRALRPGLALTPDLLEYPLSLAEGPARTFFLNSVNLLPGTLSVALEGDRLQVHLLDAAPTSIGELRQLEERVAALFGLPAAAPGRATEGWS